MNTKKMKLWTMSLFVFICLPSVSEAYFTTNQEVTKINELSALYSITYEFGFPEREVYMPIIALRGETVPTEGLYAGYVLVNDDDEKIQIGKMNGIVLTTDEDVQIKNNQYYVPAGKSASFTLVALLTIKEETIEDDVSMLVSQLPFTMIDDDSVIPAHLNPSELQYYRTPALKF